MPEVCSERAEETLGDIAADVIEALGRKPGPKPKLQAVLERACLRLPPPTADEFLRPIT